MFGVICGDTLGVPYEFAATKDKNFKFYPTERHRRSTTFSDDTVLTIAVADHLMNGTDLVDNIHKYVRQEPDRDYGCRFKEWVERGSRTPYNSFGNGSAMRVSPVAWYYDTKADVLAGAEKVAAVTHNHPEGIKGAQAVALAIFMARKGSSKVEIKNEIETSFGYNLSRDYEEVKDNCRFNETCQVSVPEAIIAFLASTDYEDAVRNAIAMGGDADTQACIAGGIAEAFYKTVPQCHIDFAMLDLPENLRRIAVEFDKKYVRAKKNAAK